MKKAIYLLTPIVLAFFCITFTGCEQTEVQSNEELVLTNLPANKNGCAPHSEFDFPLNAQSNPTNYGPGNVSGDYLFTLAPPVFSDQECLCEVMQYDLVFDDLENPEDLEIMVYDIHGKELEWFIKPGQNGEGDTLTVIGIAELPDDLLSVIVNFEPVDPTFHVGGGLCIVDNFDGMIIGDIHNQAIITTDTLSSLPPPPGTNLEVEYRAWIPVRMGTPK